MNIRFFSLIALLIVYLAGLGSYAIRWLKPPSKPSDLPRHPPTLAISHQHQSGNHHSRISTLVVHYTATDNADSLQALTLGKVSSHYLIMQGDHPIYQLVDDNKAAWHAGQSYWRGRTRLNDTSIGIEIVGLGIKEKHRNHQGFHPYSHFSEYEEKQIQQVGELLKLLSEKYTIHPKNIVAHSDIAPNRKADPGAKFPWERLHRDYGVGAWYDEMDKAFFVEEILRLQQANALSVVGIKKELADYGYQVNDTALWDLPTQQVIYAFQLHFNPKNATGVMDLETYAILKALNKKYSTYQ